MNVRLTIALCGCLLGAAACQMGDTELGRFGIGAAGAPPVDPATSCGEDGVDLDNDPVNCGSCGSVCAAGETCSEGVCRPPTSCSAGCDAAQATAVCVAGECRIASCDAGWADCNGGIADGCEANLSDDPQHCGVCGNACVAGEECTSGDCACAPPLRACGGSCTNIATDPLNCGGCNTVCVDGGVCVEGMCTPGDTCSGTLTSCGGTCVDLATAPQHCGACGVVCGPGMVCVLGTCTCAAGQTLCGGRCVDTLNDPLNCGACAFACTSGTCRAGTCLD